MFNHSLHDNHSCYRYTSLIIEILTACWYQVKSHRQIKLTYLLKNSTYLSNKPRINKKPIKLQMYKKLTFFLSARVLKHECVECGVRFLTSYKLRRHLLVHSGEKPFACGSCARRFSRQDAMQRHMLTHIDVSALIAKKWNEKINN